MRLDGSCHCGSVRFSLDSRTPYPFMRCYCSICRKQGGGGGYAINIMGLTTTHAIQGGDAVRVYQARADQTAHPEPGSDLSPARRHFCGRCGAALWVFDPRWPEWIYPFASAIDTLLPTPPELVCIMLDYKAPWADVPADARRFPKYPEESIEAWHERHGLLEAA
jgi:hypothetical protein